MKVTGQVIQGPADLSAAALLHLLRFASLRMLRLEVLGGTRTLVVSCA